MVGDAASASRAKRTLDTSKLPPAQAGRLAGEAMLLLYDVLDRVKLPAYEEVPDARRPCSSFLLESRGDGRSPTRRLPSSASRRDPRRGEYLFSSETVRRAHEFYARAQNIPYQPGAMDGFYQRVISEGGTWIPVKLIQWLPDWAKSIVWGQAAWKWVGMALTAAAWLLIVYGLRRLAHSRDGEPHYWLRFFLTLAVLPLTKGMRWFMDKQLVIAGTVFEIVDTSLLVLYFLVGATALIHLGGAIASSAHRIATGRQGQRRRQSDLRQRPYGGLAVGHIAPRERSG